jgi:hypothetical protein
MDAPAPTRSLADHELDVALPTACRQGDSESLARLLAHPGLPTPCPPGLLERCLVAAMRAQSPACVELLAQSRLFATRRAELPAIEHAIARGSMECAALIVDAARRGSPRAFAGNAEGLHFQAVSLAAAGNHHELLGAILAIEGHALDAGTLNHAIHLCRDGASECAVLLGAALDAALDAGGDAQGARALTICAQIGLAPAVRALLAVGDPVARCAESFSWGRDGPQACEGITPLMIAAAYGHGDCVEALLAWSELSRLATFRGRPGDAADIAEVAGHPDIAVSIRRAALEATVRQAPPGIKRTL